MTRRQLLSYTSAAPLLASNARAGGLAQNAVPAPPVLEPSSQPSLDDQRTAWYREAKFGMFIHWGPYSLASVEASWPIMRPSAEFKITEQTIAHIPSAHLALLPGGFGHASIFHAELWGPTLAHFLVSSVATR